MLQKPFPSIKLWSSIHSHGYSCNKQAEAMPFLTKVFISNARLNAFSRAEQDPGCKQAHLYQVRAKVHPISRHIPGSSQQMMARAEQRTRANVLQPCCCLTSQSLAICSQGTSQGRSSAIAFGVQLKTYCWKVVRK